MEVINDVKEMMKMTLYRKILFKILYFLLDKIDKSIECEGLASVFAILSTEMMQQANEQEEENLEENKDEKSYLQ